MTGFLIYFMALSLIHLFFCYFEMRVLRMITKPLILLSLSVFYAFHAKPVDPMVLIALICGLVGDVFLMLDDRFFLPGAFSFTVGHGFYIYAICARMQGDLKQHIITAAIALTAYIVIVGMSSAKLEKHVENKSFKALMPTYLGIVAIVNVLAWVNLISRIASGEGAFYASLILLGSMFFLTSDTILARAMFIKDVKRHNFPVMITYISAQALLCFGFIGLGAA